MRRLGIVAVTVGAIVLLALPVIVSMAFGWDHTRILRGPLGPGSDIWFLLLFFYVLWVPLVMIALIWCYDRLDYHYMVQERTQRPTRRRRRRMVAGQRYAAAEDQRRAREGARASRAADKPRRRDGGQQR